jgi:hypothetical protein
VGSSASASASAAGEGVERPGMVVSGGSAKLV